MKKIIICFISVVILFFSSNLSHAGWLIYHKPEFRGKVIDAETKEPIEGVVVVAIYTKHPIISGPGGGSSSIINIKETLTDQNGEFNIPSYTTLIQPLSKEDNVDFVIYKPGYGSYPGRPVYPLDYYGPEYTFSKELGSKEEKHRDGTTITVTHGVVELPKLKTWEERRKTSAISISDIPERKWPLLYKAIKEEDEWLKSHKGWSMGSE